MRNFIPGRYSSHFNTLDIKSITPSETFVELSSVRNQEVSWNNFILLNRIIRILRYSWLFSNFVAAPKLRLHRLRKIFGPRVWPQYIFF